MTSEEITSLIKKSGLNWIMPIAIVVAVGTYIYKNYREMQVLSQQYQINKYELSERKAALNS